MADIHVPPYPLYNRTYTLYRLSPLHHGDAPLLHDRCLNTHAKRLKEQLKGDNVRGVQVDFAAAEDITRLGPLEECTWQLLGDEDAWIDHYRQSAEPDASQLTSSTSPNKARGAQVSLEYEKQSYNALLLRDPGVTSSPDGFTSLPLLLVKMPGPVRDIFLNYLRTAFDANVVALNLPSTFITSTLETYLKHLSAATSTQTILHLIRQLHVQLAFPGSTSLLKHVEVTIAASDVSGFVSQGKLGTSRTSTPFADALSRYLKQHLALDMANAKTLISRISCHSFHLGTDRLKLGAPETLADVSILDDAGPSQDVSAGQLAVQDFYASLVREATGSGKFLSEDLLSGTRDGTPSSTSSTRAGRRKRASSNTGVGNDNNKKKVKARGKENGSGSKGDGDDDTMNA